MPRCSKCKHAPHQEGKCSFKDCLCVEEIAKENLFRWMRRSGNSVVKIEVISLSKPDGTLIECGVFVSTGDIPLNPSIARKLANYLWIASDVAEARLKRARI